MIEISCRFYTIIIGNKYDNEAEFVLREGVAFMTNILIIDDDRELCELMAEVAVCHGFAASHCQTIQEGIWAAHEKPFDIVFLDKQMPDGNGLEKISRFRSILPFPEVIIITGHSEPYDLEESRKNGAWSYLQKPVAPEIFIKMIQEIMPHRKRMENYWPTS